MKAENIQVQLPASCIYIYIYMYHCITGMSLISTRTMESFQLLHSGFLFVKAKYRSLSR